MVARTSAPVTAGPVFTSQPQIVPAPPSSAGQVVPLTPQQQQLQQLSLAGQTEEVNSGQQQPSRLSAASAAAQVGEPGAPAGSTAHIAVVTDYKQQVSAVQAVCLKV